MTVVSGELVVSLPGSDEFVAYPAGASFEVEAGESFQLRVAAFPSGPEALEDARLPRQALRQRRGGWRTHVRGRERREGGGVGVRLGG